MLRPADGNFTLRRTRAEPHMNESPTPTPPNPSGAPAAQTGEDKEQRAALGATAGASGSVIVLPWYRRPLFWGLLFFLLLLLLAAWLFWKEWRQAQAEKMDVAAQTEQWREHNTALDAFVQRLRALLAKEPCEVKKELETITPPAGVMWPPLAAGSGQAAPARNEAANNGAAQNAAQPSQQARQAQQAPAAAKQQTPHTVSALLEQGTVMVLAQREEGLSMGSGFFVAPGYVITNAHVVGTAAQAIIINKALGRPLQAAVSKVSHANGQDFALLTVSPQANITPLKLAQNVNRTEHVSAWGFPGAVTSDDPQFAALLKGDTAAAPEVVYTEGVVSVILERTPPLIVHTATVSQGNSGGPLVNDRGDVVGINTFIKLDDASYRQSSLAIVSSSLAAFLRAAGVPFTMAQASDAAGGRP